MSTLAVKIWLSILLLAVGVYGVYKGVGLLKQIEQNEQARAKNNLTLKPARPLSEFKFTERSGKPLGLGDLEGEIFAVNFFWGNCPGPCKILNDAVSKLADEFGGVRFVSITVDPNTDDVSNLGGYVTRNGYERPNWLFLTKPTSGTQDLIDLGASLHVTALSGESIDRTHTEDIIVIDRAGVIRGAFDHRDPAELNALKKKLRDVLAEQPPGWKPPAATASATTPTATLSPSASPAASQPKGSR